MIYFDLEAIERVIKMIKEAKEELKKEVWRNLDIKINLDHVKAITFEEKLKNLAKNITKEEYLLTLESYHDYYMDEIALQFNNLEELELLKEELDNSFWIK